MEIKYQNNRHDFKVYYESLWRKTKSSQKSDYYSNALWYLAVLGLAIFTAVKHDEGFTTCIFIVLAIIYIKQNWSFEKKWNATTELSCIGTPEVSAVLILDDTGATERFSGVQLHAPWSVIHDYTVHDQILFIRFLKNRSFIIPIRYLSSSALDELISILESHNIHKKEI